MPVYDLGDRRTLSCALTDAHDTPVDPTTLVFQMREPDGTSTVYIYGTDTELVRDGAGEYHVDWDCTQAGRHYWRYTASGNVGSAEESLFTVRASMVDAVTVTGATVAAFLGQADDDGLVALAEQHAAIVTALARGYTRGRGFAGAEPAPDIKAVITTATARLVGNPEQIATDVGSVSIRGGWQGWNLAELSVLNRYRVRAQ